ncbi:copper transporter [Cellulomonas sp. URHD0024]|uniref:copper transporter n=1 Tax=Cellulomonas sp. URHD0024 TaxID=1302620 RepID=UPI0003FD0EF9|nr:copper transporter [Cellulomonas sp. URHD0024]
MIDFRYHVVSLISVFLALAVGIALGAGPLKETIGDTLTGQVQQLRTEKDALRAELDTNASAVKDSEAYIDASGPQLLDGSLTDRRVAIIALGDVPEKSRTALDQRLDQSGATVTAHVTLTDMWTDPDVRTFRQALVSQLTQYLDPTPPADAGAEADLASALVQALVTADPANPDVLSNDAGTLLDVLSSSENKDNPLVTIAEDVTMPADAIVVVAVPLEPVAAGATPSPEPAASVVAAQIAVLTAAQELSSGAVLADGPRGKGALTDAVLADGDLSAALTTVSGTDAVTGQINVPLALANRIGGKNGHYGFDEGETVLPPAIELPPVSRAAAVPENAGAGSAP